MKTISADLAQHLASEVTTLATCWKITRRDGVVLAIVTAARSWLGTPWRHQGRLKGTAVDCGGLILGVGRELGLLDLKVRGYGRIPDGQQLRTLCEQHLDPRPIADIRPGDVLLMRFTRHPQHLAIVGDRGTPFSLIHAYADVGACVEHGADPKWRRRIIAAYTFRQPAV